MRQRHDPCERDGDWNGRDPFACTFKHVPDRLGIDPNCTRRAEPGRRHCIASATRGERWADAAAPPYGDFIRVEALAAASGAHVRPDGVVELCRP